MQCWGDNALGQSTPPDSIAFSSVSAGGNHTCAIQASDGRVQCWGDNALGQSTPPDSIAFSSISAGDKHTCGVRLSDRRLQCWPHVAIHPVFACEPFATVSVGGRAVCGLYPSGAAPGPVSCWQGL